MTSIHNLVQNGLSLSLKLYSSHCGTSLHRRQCFILLPNVWAVFKIYFAILHKIVAINNVQQSIRLNKQREKRKKNRDFALLPVSHVTHPGHLLLAHGRMEEMF